MRRALVSLNNSTKESAKIVMKKSAYTSLKIYVRLVPREINHQSINLKLLDL